MNRLFLKSTLYILHNSCPRTGRVDRSVRWYVRVDQTPRGGLPPTDHSQGQGEGHSVCPGKCLHAGLLPTLPLHQGIILKLYGGGDGHSKEREREREGGIRSINNLLNVCVCDAGGGGFLGRPSHHLIFVSH